jgi:hypothetical protein
MWCVCVCGASPYLAIGSGTWNAVAIIMEEDAFILRVPGKGEGGEWEVYIYIYIYIYIYTKGLNHDVT